MISNLDIESRNKMVEIGTEIDIDANIKYCWLPLAPSFVFFKFLKKTQDTRHATICDLYHRYGTCHPWESHSFVTTTAWLHLGYSGTFHLWTFICKVMLWIWVTHGVGDRAPRKTELLILRLKDRSTHLTLTLHPQIRHIQ